LGASCYPKLVGNQHTSLVQLSEQRVPLLMGVLNVTPDSFYDGGRYTSVPDVERRIDRMLQEGAHVLDIGAESSRPGSAPVSATEQIDRMRAALAHARERGALVSVDTTSPEVADYALSHGASVVNDVSCLEDTELAQVTARHGAELILMHSRLPMAEMAGFSQYPADGYRDVVSEVSSEWLAARERALQAGLSRERVLFDPGLGFSKSANQSFELLERLAEFAALGAKIVVGASRKSFIASTDGSAPDERLGGSLAAALLCVERGAHVVRVHDVRETAQALAVLARSTTSRQPRKLPEQPHV
jgi:dihydropteroate synthase